MGHPGTDLQPTPDADVTDDAARERALIARVTAGDREAFGILVEQHIGRSLVLAYRVLRHREDAEDLIQDAFLAALQHIEAFDAQRRFWPWLARIIVNRGLDMADARAVRVTDPLPDDVAHPQGTAADTAEYRELLSRFRHELALLPPRQQLVVQLFELDGYTVAEIARLLSSTTSAVRWNLHAGRTRLREVLKPFRDTHHDA